MLNSNLNATLPQRRGSGTIDPSEPREGTASSSTQDTRDAPRPTTPVPPALQGLVGGAPPPQRAPITGAGPAGAARTETPLATLEAWVAAAPADEDRAETSARVLESRASGRLLLPNSGLRALPPRLGELCPQAIEFSFYSSNRVREPLDISELPLQLQNLSLSYNNLTAPPSLERLVQLRTVSLGSNRLEEAPAVHMLPLLERLYVHTNNLRRPPDVTRCGQLQVLHLSNNPLIEMPEVRGLVNLRTLMLSNTALTSLPRWIEDLPPTLHIELDNCPLDQETRAFIERLRAERRGPEISHSPPPPPRLDPGAQPLAAQPLAARPTSLREQAGIWLAVQSEMSDDQRQALLKRWEGFAQEPDAEHFNSLLFGLTKTKDFRNSEASRKALGQRVADVLGVLAQDDELRGRCFATAQEGLNTCGDRIAVAFGNIEMATRAHALAGQPDALLKLAQGIHRLALLDQIAVQDIERRYGELRLNSAAEVAAAVAQRGVLVEEVEIVLAYHVKLAKALDLPGQPEHMLFENLARVSEQQLAQAKEAVLAREREDTTGRITSIAAQPFWQASLETQPACAEAIAQLRDRRTLQTDKLNQSDKQRRKGATKEERDSEASELNLNYRSNFGAIKRRYDEGVQSVHRQFTRIAMNRVADDLPAIDADLPPPAHVIGAAKVSDIAVQLQRLVRKGETAEARILACELLEPELLAALHPVPPSEMGRGEAEAMDIVNIQYMDLLRTLAAEGLLDKVAFDRLRGADALPRENAAPYLLYIASRAGAGVRDMPAAASQLAHAAVELLKTLAATRELGNGQSRKEMLAEMCAALLVPRHPGQTQGLHKDRNDFFSRILMSGSPAALRAARELDAAHLLPTGKHVKMKLLSSARLAEFEKVAKQAHKASSPSVSKTVPAKGEELAELVRTLGELNVVAEHASHVQMQREQEVARQAQEHADKVRRSIYSAVDSAVGKQWEDGARKARKGLAPHGSTVIFDPVAAAARASAAGSLSATAPDGMALDLHKALLDSPEGKALLQALERTGQFYDKDKPEHSAFEKLLQAAAAIHVQRTLAPIESSLRRQVQTTVRASLARDIVVQATLQLQRDADAEEATLRVHTKANEPPTSSGGLPSTSGGASQGPSVERARLGTSASLARSEGQGQSQGPATRTPINAAPTVPASPQGAGPSRAEESTLLRAMPSAPNDPLRTARRNQEPASRQ